MGFDRLERCKTAFLLRACQGKTALDRLLLVRLSMQGLITERHFESAEKTFPGIREFYRALRCKPATFLELVWEYERHAARPSERTGKRRRHAARPAR